MRVKVSGASRLGVAVATMVVIVGSCTGDGDDDDDRQPVATQSPAPEAIASAAREAAEALVVDPRDDDEVCAALWPGVGATLPGTPSESSWLQHRDRDRDATWGPTLRCWYGDVRYLFWPLTTSFDPERDFAGELAGPTASMFGDVTSVIAPVADGNPYCVSWLTAAPGLTVLLEDSTDRTGSTDCTEEAAAAAVSIAAIINALAAQHSEA